MQKSKIEGRGDHTPGPWLMDNGEIAASDGQVVIGRVYAADDFLCTYPDEDEGVQEFDAECRANARLIIAAPDLLAVCQQLKIYCEGVSVGCDQDKLLLFELYHSMVAAVRKATVEEQIENAKVKD